MRARLLWTLLLLAGCAWEPGEGFAVLEPTVRAAYTPLAAREAGGGFQQLSSDFQVRLDTAALRLARIELLGSSGAGGPSSFDPANPPPGYTICHNGHCDREDGTLVDYEDVEAELAGGAATTTSVATLPLSDEADLLAPRTREVPCEPDCELPRTTVNKGRWTVTGLTLEGTVRDGRVPARFSGERPFRLALTAEEGGEPVVALEGPLDVPSDRAHAPRVRLELLLELTPALFDALDWEATSAGPDGVVDLGTEAHAPVRKALLERLGAQQPTAEVSRDGW